jgi:tetratricopeptide (TPR) repeat protein
VLALLACGENARAATSAEENLAQPDLTPAAQAFNRAAVALAQHQPQQAIDLLAPLRRDEQPGNNAQALRGFAYMELKKPADAVVEFRKLAGRKSQLLTQSYPWAQVQLARALVAAGKKTDAKKTYEEFLQLWKNADPGLPLHEQATREYEALK